MDTTKIDSIIHAFSSLMYFNGIRIFTLELEDNDLTKDIQKEIFDGQPWMKIKLKKSLES